MKKRFCLLGFCGPIEREMCHRSLDRRIPAVVAISAISLIVLGMVTVVVVCRVEIFVMVPIMIDANVSRESGLVMVIVSWWVL